MSESNLVFAGQSELKPTVKPFCSCNVAVLVTGLLRLFVGHDKAFLLNSRILKSTRRSISVKAPLVGLISQIVLQFSGIKSALAVVSAIL